MKALGRLTLWLCSALALVAVCMPLSASASVDPVSVGANATCAAVPAGGVNCWGVPAGYGDLDDWITRDIADDVPTPLYGITGVATDVAVTGDHGCAVVGGGAVCWGVNTSGQLGDGSTDDSDLPVNVQGFDSGVTDVAVADGVSCAIKSGAVSCWGNRNAGLMGSGSIGIETSPVAVPTLSSGASSLAVAEQMGCVVVSSQAICWGRAYSPMARAGEYGEILSPGVSAGLTSGVESIVIGSGHACAIVTGAVKCWGANGSGQLGDGTVAHVSTDTPRQVTGLTSGVTAIAAGYRITCAIVSGAVKCWGENHRGLRGDGTYDGTTSQPSTPVDVTGLSSGVDAVSVGSRHICARQSGTVKCWGAASLGQLGNAVPVRSSTPIAVSGGASLTKLAVGDTRACGTAAGVAKCWGDTNGYNWIQPTVPVAMNPPFDNDVASVSVGYSGVCGVINGSVRCGEGGIVGLETGAIAVSSHDLHACGATSTKVLCWGDEYTFVDPTPISISGVGNGITALASGFRFDCAIAGGAARCWGENYENQLGVSTTPVDRRTPVTPTGLSSGVTAIAAGRDFACAVVSGAAKCWGDGYSGQLGNGSLADKSAPTQVTGLTSGVTSISASEHHACALTNGGAIYCWGENDVGQLGSGDLEESSVPVQVQGAGSGATEVSAGSQTTCGRIGGVAKCWGSNKRGMLGAGKAFHELTPVPTAAPANPKPFVANLSPEPDSLHAVHSVAFEAFSDSAATIYCKIDGRPYIVCPELMTDLEDGDHSVRTKVTDTNGHSDTDVTYFRVDTTPPVLVLGDIDDDLTATGDIWREIGFSANEPIASAQCFIDGDGPYTCGSYARRFSLGVHTVSATATDLAGNVGTATGSFRVGPLPVVPPPPPADRRSSLSYTYLFSGSYKKGNRKLVVRVRLVNRDAMIPGRCAGAIRFAAPKLGKEKSFPLATDPRLIQCNVARTYKLKRATKGKRINFNFTFDGNAFYNGATKSASRKL